MCLSIMEKIVVVQLSSYRSGEIIMKSLWCASLFGMKETDHLTGGSVYVLVVLCGFRVVWCVLGFSPV